MKKLIRILTLIAITAAAVVLPGAARADELGEDLDHINVTYHGGPLMQNVQVSTLFMGQEWQGSRYPDYLNNFFKALFDDGRYMATLSQYSTDQYQIDNGQFAGTAWYQRPVGNRVTDDDIRATIALGIQAKALPKPAADSLYVVYTAPGAVVFQSNGEKSGDDFYGYHAYVTRSPVGAFAYAVIPFPEEEKYLTLVASHEMAEAVTDPQVTSGRPGWLDRKNGEIGDIPLLLYYAGRITEADTEDTLVGANGTRYLVEKEWSVRDGAPVAFTERTAG